MSRATRWWTKVLNYLKKLFKVSTSPYKAAAYRMLGEGMKRAAQVNTQFANPGVMFQATTEGGMSKQQQSVTKLLDVHNNLRKVLMPVDKIPGLDMKLVKEGETEIEVYVYTNPTTNEETVLPERVTNKTARAFAKNKTKEQTDKINNNPRNKHLALGGNKLHGVAQNLMEFLGNKSKLISVETTHPAGIPKTLDTSFTIDGKPMQSDKDIKTKFKSGIGDIVNQIEVMQNEINELENTPDGKAVLLTELQVRDNQPLDKGQPIAGTMDVVVVFSNGKMGIVDFKFITPQGFYTEGYGQKTKLAIDPMQVRISGYNTQIGAYKDILIKEYQIDPSDFAFTRIAPVHIQYKVKNWKKKDYTLTDEVEVFEMGADQNEFMKQISVAGELTDYKGLNTFLTKLYRQRAKYENRLGTEKGKKGQNLRDRIKKLNRTIQGVTVERNIAVIVQDAADAIGVIQKRLQISDPKHEDYLEMEDLRDILKDFDMYNALNTDTSDYLEQLDKLNPEAANKVRSGIGAAANRISTNYAAIQEVMFTRLRAKGKELGIDTTEKTKETNWSDNNLTTMSQSKNPIVRQAYSMIYDSFNKTKQETDAVYDTIMKADARLGKWAKNNGMSKYNAMKNKLVNPKTGNLFPKLKGELYTEVLEKQKTGDIKWLKENLQPKKGWKEKVAVWRQNKITNLKLTLPDKLDETGKIIKSNAKGRNAILAEFDAMYNLSKDTAWKNPRWQNMLEFKEATIERELTEEYKELLQPGNADLKAYYDMYWKVNRVLGEITPDFLQGNFVSNTRDDMIQSVINNGFSFDGFTDRMHRTFTSHHTEEQGQYISNPDGTLVSKIPIPGLAPLRDSKQGLNVGMKSKDLSKALYDLSLSVFNYKHMDQIESTILALGDQLFESDMTMSNTFGQIRREHGVPVTMPVKGTSTQPNPAGQKQLDAFNKLISFYLYGHSTQSKDVMIGGLSMNRTAKTLMSWYSAKKLAFPILPALAAKTLGEANLWSQSIDGISYDRAGMYDARKMFVGNMSQYSFFANVFDAFQTPQSWVKSRGLAAKKASKYLELGNIFEPLRWADESLDRQMAVAMGYKHGIDSEGNLKRLDQLPEGSKNLHELTEKLEDGTYMITGMTEVAYNNFKARIKAEGSKIKGQMDSTDIVAAKLTLMGAMLGQFKWWMPGLLSERFKARKFNPVLEYMEEGRYGGMGRHLASNWTPDVGIRQNLIQVGKTAVNSLMELAMLKKFNGDPFRRKKLMDKGKWSESDEAKYQAKRDMLSMEMKEFKANSTDPGILDMDVDDYLKMRTRSIKRSLADVRAILGTYLLFSVLGAVGPDDEKFMQQQWGTRQLMKVLGRARRELGFVLDPRELTYMLQGGIPVIGLFNDMISVVTNGAQESYDIAIGRQTLLQALGYGRKGRDKSPLFYHAGDFVIGVEKLRQIFEPYAQDKINPYK